MPHPIMQTVREKSEMTYLPHICHIGGFPTWHVGTMVILVTQKQGTKHIMAKLKGVLSISVNGMFLSLWGSSTNWLHIS